MKFKNYVNKHAGDNRIYSFNDITQMALGDVLKNKEELLSQYRELGVPSDAELQSSENVVYVHAYTRDDGTEVKAHYRSKPNFELGVEKNVYAEPQIQAKQTQPILPQLQQTTSMPSVVQNQNIPNPNINGINQDELSGILERMLKLPYLNNDTNNQYNFGGEKNSNLPVIENIQGFLNQIQEGAKDKAAKIEKDYGGLTPLEKLQKMASKHVSWWVPSEYYGISEYLADDGKMPDKYKKHNEHYKLGDISDERTKAIITSKVQRARKDCPVGPYINTPLEDVDVIVPKDNSDLVKEVKRSDEIAEFIEKNKEKLQAGETVSGSIEFKRPPRTEGEWAIPYVIRNNDKIGRFTAIHMADIVDAKMNDDGTVSMKLVDYYDFTKLEENDGFDELNNRAYRQQELGKLKPYALYFELTY